ncbi:MAG: hypothetical protein U0Z44_18895 [Kouleothrix sp.]
MITASGSTGQPKGVLVPHYGIGNMAQAQIETATRERAPVRLVPDSTHRWRALSPLLAGAGLLARRQPARFDQWLRAGGRSPTPTAIGARLDRRTPAYADRRRRRPAQPAKWRRRARRIAASHGDGAISIPAGQVPLRRCRAAIGGQSPIAACCSSIAAATAAADSARGRAVQLAG